MLIYHKPKIFDVDLYGLAAVAGVLLLCWFFLIKPLDNKLQQRRQSQQDYHQNKETAQAELVQLRKLVTRQRSLSERLSRTRDLLKDNTGLDRVVSEIASFSQECSVRLDEIIPGEPTVEQYCRRTDLNMKLFGSFPQLHNLLTEIAEKLPFVRINSLNINDQQATENGLCEINLELHVFAPK